MRIAGCLRNSWICTHRCITFVGQKIKAIWLRVQLAYQERKRQLPPLVLPSHPIPNTYPKQHKNRNWPDYLNNSSGIWGNPNNTTGIAQFVEPLERVTPLHAVTMGDNLSGLYRLIAADAPIEAADIRGQTPVYWAAYHGNLSALTALKLYGANLSKKDLRGKTPLRAAAKKGHADIVTFLASHKVDLNERDGKGLSALHVAAFNGRFSVYSRLILHGADHTLKDSFGRTAEDILKLKYAEIYHKKSFISRIFSSRLPPQLPLQHWGIQNIAKKVSV